MIVVACAKVGQDNSSKSIDVPKTGGVTPLIIDVYKPFIPSQPISRLLLLLFLEVLIP